MLTRLALKSLWSRRLTLGLIVLATALSVALLLGVEKVRTGARDSFAGTVAGVDLIVGARSGSVQLLLYSVFRIGDATNNVSWESYQDVAAMPGVAWTVPLSLGDSHRGYRVLGTTTDYFDRYRYRGDRALEFAEGARFEDLFDAVVGADVAAALGYRFGDKITVAHGVASFVEHDDKPFRISGVLAKTGTPVDRTVHVSLEAIEAIHVDWRGGARDPALAVTADQVRAMDLTPRAITAALVGVESRLGVFALQRRINQYAEEPLLAVLPGLALQELWRIVGLAETALLAVSGMVVVTALIGMAATIFATLEARRREMAILRAVGARPATIAALLAAEAGAIAAAGAVLGLALVYLGLWVARPLVDAAYGLYLPVGVPGWREAAILSAVAASGVVAGLAPAWRAWRLSLADGLTVRS
jgi:putative ABC transport system permease protein